MENDRGERERQGHQGHATLLKAAFGDDGVDGDVPVADVATEAPRRSERRGREPEELCDFVLDREYTVSSDSGGGSVFTTGCMMAVMRGSRIFRPDD